MAKSNRLREGYGFRKPEPVEKKVKFERPSLKPRAQFREMHAQANDIEAKGDFSKAMDVRRAANKIKAQTTDAAVDRLVKRDWQPLLGGKTLKEQNRRLDIGDRRFRGVGEAPDEPVPTARIKKLPGGAGETLGAAAGVLGVVADLKEAKKNASVGPRNEVISGPLGPGSISRDFGAKKRKPKV
jgi:hypothetical protein